MIIFILDAGKHAFVRGNDFNIEAVHECYPNSIDSEK